MRGDLSMRSPHVLYSVLSLKMSVLFFEPYRVYGRNVVGAEEYLCYRFK